MLIRNRNKRYFDVFEFPECHVLTSSVWDSLGISMIKISAKTRQFRGSPRHWGRGPRRRVVQPLAAAAAAAVVTVATQFSPPQPPALDASNSSEQPSESSRESSRSRTTVAARMAAACSLASRTRCTCPSLPLVISVCMWYATDINAMECSANLECSRMQRCCMIGKCMLMQHECSTRKMRRCGHADSIQQNAQKCIVMRPYADGQKQHRIRAETTRDPLRLASASHRVWIMN